MISCDRLYSDIHSSSVEHVVRWAVVVGVRSSEVAEKRALLRTPTLAIFG